MMGGGMEVVEVCPVEGCEWRDDPPGEKRTLSFPGVAETYLDANSWVLKDVGAVTAHVVEAHPELVNLPRVEGKEGLFKVDLWARYAPKET